MKERSYQGIPPSSSRFAGFSVLNLLIVVIAISGLYFGVSTASPLSFVIIGGSVIALISALSVIARRRYGNIADRQKQVSTDEEALFCDEKRGPDGSVHAVMDAESAMLAVFNIDYLLDSMDGDHDSVVIILEVFLSDHSDDGKKLRQALLEGDRDQALLIAHSLKGVSASLGAESLRRVSEQLEKDIRDGVERLQPLCQQLNINLEQLILAVNHFLQQNRNEMVQTNVVIDEHDAAQPDIWALRKQSVPISDDIINEQWIDLDALVKSQGGDHEAVRMLLEMFIEDNADDGKAFAALATQSGQETPAKSVIHRLNGGAASIAAEPLRAKSEEIEMCLKQHEVVTQADSDSLVFILAMTVKSAQSYITEAVVQV